MPKTIKLIIISLFFLLSIGCSSFHVQVIDQHGKPVPDVKVRVGVLTNLFLVSGGRTDFYSTDDEGRFTLGGPRSHIELIQKNGYEFRDKTGFGSTSIYSHYDGYGAEDLKREDNSYSNPYYILAWKRENPETLIGKEYSKGIRLIPDGKYYEVAFSNEGIRQKKLVDFKTASKTNAVLLVRYREFNKIVRSRQNKKKHPWELTLIVPNGGLFKTNDIIRNLAPKDGYKQKWVIRSDDLENVDSRVSQKFYIKAKNGQLYGQFTFKFRPQFTTLSIEPYWLNPNGSRNLTRPKKYVYCKSSRFVSRNCSLDDFGP